MRKVARAYVELEAPTNGHFVAPAVYLLDNLNQLQREVFGPILHIVRYKKENLVNVLNEVNAKGYALTGGCHSRIRKQMDLVEKHLHCGNFYINRNIVGAVVGVQPFWWSWFIWYRPESRWRILFATFNKNRPLLQPIRR